MKRNNGANRIPEKVQEPMRNRLRMLRETLGILKVQVNAISEGTIGSYETKDLSSMKLGDLWALGREYGWTFSEFLVYLIGNDETELLEEARNIKRVSVYLRSMPLVQQQMACDILKVMVDASTTEPKRAAKVVHADT